MDSQTHEMAYDLGDGFTSFRAVLADRQAVIRLSLLDFFAWYDALPRGGEDPYASLRAVQGHVKDGCGVDLNLAQCDALLRAAHAEMESLRGKPVGRLSLPPSMGRLP